MPLDIGLIGHNVVVGDGQGHAFLALSEALLERGHRLTVYAQRVDPSIADRATVVRLPAPGGPQALVDLAVFVAATSAVRRRRHDVVCVLGPCALPRRPYAYYAQFSQAGWRSTWTRATRPKLYHRLHSRIGLALERTVAGGAGIVIACSPNVGVEMGIDATRLRVTPNGVDPERFGPARDTDRKDARARLGVPDGAVAIALIGEFATTRKGLDSLTAALAMGPADEHLLVAGAGPVERARAAARREGVADRVHFLGFTPAETVLHAADVCAVPSRYEPFSLVALEAACAGVPLALSARAGAAGPLRDVVAVIDDPDDPRAVRAALDEARAGDPQRVAAAREAACRLTWSRTASVAAQAVEAAAGVLQQP